MDDFKFYLVQKGLRQSTIESHLDKWIQISKHCPNFSDDEFIAHLLFLKDQGRKGSYLNHLIFTMREIRKWKEEPLPQIRFFKEDISIKSTLSDVEIEQILNLKPLKNGLKYKAHWNKWTLFFSILAYTGMRPNEVATLKVESVDFGRQVFVLQQTKTLPRLVPIPPILWKCLSAHVKLTQKGYLFPSQKDYSAFPYVNDVDWGHNFKVRLKMLEILRPRLSVYSLRHSFITRLLDEDINIFKVQKLVGHRRLETTAHYTHFTTKDIQKTIRKDPLTRQGNEANETVQQIIEVLKSFHLEKDKRFNMELTELSNELLFRIKW